MKVVIGKPKSWFGPYQLASLLCFWAKKEKDVFGIEHEPEWVHRFGEWLAYGSIDEDSTHTPLADDPREPTLLYKFLSWVDSKRTRKINVRIDRFDTWNLDETLAHIALPMLKQLRDTKHGYPHVDEEDVPENLRIYDPNDGTTYDQLPLFEYNPINPENISVKSDQWDWVLDEMIYAFSHIIDQKWTEQYSSGVCDLQHVPCEWDDNGKPVLYRLQDGPNHTHDIDYVGLQQHWERIDNGLRLFGKYYRNLWD